MTTTIHRSLLGRVVCLVRRAGSAALSGQFTIGLSGRVVLNSPCVGNRPGDGNPGVLTWWIGQRPACLQLTSVNGGWGRLVYGE